MSKTWQLKTPVQTLIFDCDSTLSTLEGIDELARLNGIGDEVAALTHDAMSHTGLNPDLYKARLDLVKPNQQQVIDLGQSYYEHVTLDAPGVINLLQRLQKNIYLVSAGLSPAVTLFGELLKIPPSHIFAVPVFFDKQQEYLDFDHQSPLVDCQGKRKIVELLTQQHQELIYVGDGLNDLAVYDLVSRFIGYGGVAYRDKIANQCDFYIKTRSLASVLPLCLTAQEVNNLLPDEKDLYQQGLEAIQTHQVKAI